MNRRAIQYSLIKCNHYPAKMRVLVTVLLLSGSLWKYGESELEMNTPKGVEWHSLTPYNITASGRSHILFCVKACYNARIGLFTQDNNVSSYYVVLIGGYKDTLSLVRRTNEGDPDKDGGRAQGSRLDCDVFKRFNVSWGALGISACTEKECFLFWTDPSPLDINFISISTYTNAAGIWKIYTEDNEFPYCIDKYGDSSTRSVTSVLPETDRCSCPTSCPNTNKQTTLTIDQMIAEIKVNKKDTVLYKSRLSSAHDDRPSARSIGVLAIVLMCLPFAALLMIDLINVWK